MFLRLWTTKPHLTFHHLGWVLSNSWNWVFTLWVKCSFKWYGFKYKGKVPMAGRIRYRWTMATGAKETADIRWWLKLEEVFRSIRSKRLIGWCYWKGQSSDCFFSDDGNSHQRSLQQTRSNHWKNPCGSNPLGCLEPGQKSLQSFQDKLRQNFLCHEDRLGSRLALIGGQ